VAARLRDREAGDAQVGGVDPRAEVAAAGHRAGRPCTPEHPTARRPPIRGHTGRRTAA